MERWFIVIHAAGDLLYFAAASITLAATLADRVSPTHDDDPTEK